MDFCLAGLPAAPFKHLYSLTDEQLRALGVRRVIVDAPGCCHARVERVS